MCLMSVFLIDYQDNDTYAFRGYPTLTEHQRMHQALVPDMSGPCRVGVHRCVTCGQLTRKWAEPLLGLVIKKRKYDISITYDGVVVVSKRFKSLVEEAPLSGLTFRVLPNDPGFYSIYPPMVVPFDSERRKTQFIKPCQQCGQYESVVGASPVYLKSGVELAAREFARTDLEFGSDDEKAFLLLCGNDAAIALSKANLRGLDLDPVN